MEDRYLFKAKKKNWQELPKDEQWVQGYYYQIWENGYILWGMTNDVPNMIEIDVSTLCQCTSLKDKNGNLIWENDILHNGNYFVVKWNESCSRFDIVLNKFHNIPIGKWEPMICDWKTNDFKEYRKAVDYEVIGNVFDNPELLESEKK